MKKPRFQLDFVTSLSYLAAWPSLESRPLQVFILLFILFFFAWSTDPPSHETGRWETKQFFYVALLFFFVDLPLLNTTELVKTSRMFVCIWQTIASTRKMLTLSGNCEELFILFYSPYWIKNLSLWNYKAAIVDSFMSYSVTFVNKVGQSDLEFF